MIVPKKPKADPYDSFLTKSETSGPVEDVTRENPIPYTTDTKMSPKKEFVKGVIISGTLPTISPAMIGVFLPTLSENIPAKGMTTAIAASCAPVTMPILSASNPKDVA